VSRRQGSNVDVGHCTTRFKNPHGTVFRELLYHWHPWFGMRVAIHGAVDKADGVVFCCTLSGSGADGDHGTSHCQLWRKLASRAVSAGPAGSPLSGVKLPHRDGPRVCSRALSKPTLQTRTRLCRQSNRSLSAQRIPAGKKFGEARDQAGIFGEVPAVMWLEFRAAQSPGN
jgi:hypothetical protein